MHAFLVTVVTGEDNSIVQCLQRAWDIPRATRSWDLGLSSLKKKEKNIYLPRRQIFPLSGWIIGFLSPQVTSETRSGWATRSSRATESRWRRSTVARSELRRTQPCTLTSSPSANLGGKVRAAEVVPECFYSLFSSVAIHTRIKCPLKAKQKSFVMTENQQFFWTYASPQEEWWF